MIRRLRVEKGWTQEQLSRFSGLHVRTIQRMERGQPAALESIKALAAVFEMEVSVLQQGYLSSEVQFLGTTPILPVSSVKESIVFYQQQLGFEVEVLWKDPPYGVVAREQAIIEFGEGRPAAAGSGVCNIFVCDVDAIYREYREKKIEFVGEIGDRDYGSRDFRIRDNSGNILIFTAPLPNQQVLLAAGSQNTTE